MNNSFMFANQVIKVEVYVVAPKGAACMWVLKASLKGVKSHLQRHVLKFNGQKSR